MIFARQECPDWITPLFLMIDKNHVIGQVYQIGIDVKQARPGQFVFKDNKSDNIVGFISAVYPQRMIAEICLFDPGQLPVSAVLVEKVIDETVVISRLKFALKKNPEMRDEWSDLLSY